jgi:hypothetical protein
MPIPYYSLIDDDTLKIIAETFEVPRWGIG